MLNMILFLLQTQIPQPVADATKPIIEYGVVGGILVLALSGIVYMYTTNNKREKERHELFRGDMTAVANANRAERERWQIIDGQRFQVLQDITNKHTEATIKNTDALSQLATIIKERVQK